MATDVTATVRAVVAVVDQATGPLKGIQAAFRGFAAPIEGVVGKLRAIGDTTGLSKLGGAFKSAAGMVGSFASSVLKLAAPLAGLSGVAGLGGLTAALHSFVSEGDRLDDTAAKVGVTVEALQDLEHWGSKADVAAGTLHTAIGRLTKTVGEAAGGGKKAAEAFKDIGVSVVDAAGRARPTMDVLKDVARTIQRMPDDATRAAAANKLFGRAWQELLPLLMQGPEGLAKASAEMQKLGRITGDEAAKAGRLADAQAALGKAISGVGNAVAGLLVPHLLPLVEGLTNLIAANREVIKTTLAEWFKEVGAALKEVDWASLGRALAFLLDVAVKVGTELAKMAASTVREFNAIAQAVAGVIEWFARLWPTVRQTWDAVATAVREGVGQVAAAMGEVRAALETPLMDVFAGLAAQLAEAFAPLTDAARAARERLQQAWDAIAATVRGGIERIAEAMRGLRAALETPLGDVFAGLFAGLTEGLAGAAGDLGARLRDALSGLGGALEAAIAPLRQVAERAWAGVVRVFETGTEAIRRAVAWLEEALAPLTAMLERVLGLTDRVLGGIQRIVGGVRDAITGAGEAEAAAAKAAETAATTQAAEAIKAAEEATRAAEKAALKAQRTAEKAAAAAGPPAALPPPAAPPAVAAPAARGPGPWLPEIATPEGGAPAQGTVNVVIENKNAPPGTRMTTKTAGKGVTSESKVGYSMPQLLPMGAG
jgi:phage-related protein